MQTLGYTYLVTTLIFTPKTPVCFLDGVLFRLISRLVNFMENSTLIWSGYEVGTNPPDYISISEVPPKHRVLPPQEDYLETPALCKHLQLGGKGTGQRRGERLGKREMEARPTAQTVPTR
jgi:hypothetical protein